MYFCDLFLSSSSVFQETCQPKQLIYAIKQSSIGLKSIHYLGGKLWNAMPIEFQMLHQNHHSNQNWILIEQG